MLLGMRKSVNNHDNLQMQCDLNPNTFDLKCNEHDMKCSFITYTANCCKHIVVHNNKLL